MTALPWRPVVGLTEHHEQHICFKHHDRRLPRRRLSPSRVPRRRHPRLPPRNQLIGLANSAAAKRAARPGRRRLALRLTSLLLHSSITGDLQRRRTPPVTAAPGRRRGVPWGGLNSCEVLGLRALGTARHTPNEPSLEQLTARAKGTGRQSKGCRGRCGSIRHDSRAAGVHGLLPARVPAMWCERFRLLRAQLPRTSRRTRSELGI